MYLALLLLSDFYQTSSINQRIFLLLQFLLLIIFVIIVIFIIRRVKSNVGFAKKDFVKSRRTGTGTDTGTGSCDDITLQAQLTEAHTLYQAVMPMVVAENDIMGEWPIPLSSVITPPTGVYTAGLETHNPFHIDATMKTEAEGVASCFAGKTIHFVFEPTVGTWGCNTDIPAEDMTLFPMICN